MQRFFKILVTIFAVCFTTLPSVFAETYEEGVHYQLVSPPQPTSTVNKVEVLEIFWYGCPHCFRFEPYVERWLKKVPENAQFVRMPGVFRPSWEAHARAFYTAELLGVFEKIHKPLFNAIHLEKKVLETEEALADFFVETAAVDKAEFVKTFKSFAVETRLSRAKTMSQRYGIDGVPAVIVNGKYSISAKGAGSNAEMLKIIDFLVEKESKPKS